MAAEPGGGSWLRKLNGGRGCRWPWKLRFANCWRWKRPNLRFSFLDDLLFNILYCLEAVLLVGALCCFYLCCGCHL